MKNKNNSTQRFIKIIALVSLVVGTAGSLYFMFNVSRENNSVVLIGLFTFWVLSPFVGLFVVKNFSTSWSAIARIVLYWLMVVLAIGSLIAYSDVLTPDTAKPAFIFLVVPLASWFLIVIVVITVRKLFKKNSDPKQT